MIDDYYAGTSESPAIAPRDFSKKIPKSVLPNEYYGKRVRVGANKLRRQPKRKVPTPDGFTPHVLQSKRWWEEDESDCVLDPPPGNATSQHGRSF